MSEEIVKIDIDHLMIVETTVEERVVARVTLEAQKTALLAQIAEIDTKLIILDTVEVGKI